MGEAKNTILVTGATGQAGNAVARHLLSAGRWQLRALTRNAANPVAKELAAAGVEIFEGDLKEKDAIERAIDGAYGVYSVQQYWEHGAELEVRMGMDVADAALNAGVEHFVFQSAGSRNHTHTGAPHLDTKREVDAYLRKSPLSALCTIVRPVAFMENFFLPGWRKDILDGILTMPLAPAKPYQLIAVNDIGAVVAAMFDNPNLYRGNDYDIVGDELTGPQMADVLSAVSGKSVRYVELPLADFAQYNEDLALMYKWLNEFGYDADLSASRSIYSQMLNFEAWVRASRLTDPTAGPPPTVAKAIASEEDSYQVDALEKP